MLHFGRLVQDLKKVLQSLLLFIHLFLLPSSYHRPFCLKLFLVYSPPSHISLTCLFLIHRDLFCSPVSLSIWPSARRQLSQSRRSPSELTNVRFPIVPPNQVRFLPASPLSPRTWPRSRRYRQSVNLGTSCGRKKLLPRSTERCPGLVYCSFTADSSCHTARTSGFAPFSGRGSPGSIEADGAQ